MMDYISKMVDTVGRVPLALFTERTQLTDQMSELPVSDGHRRTG